MYVLLIQINPSAIFQNSGKRIHINLKNIVKINYSWVTHFTMNFIFSRNILDISLFMVFTPYGIELMDLKGEKKEK